jgi:hypothetical protein
VNPVKKGGVAGLLGKNLKREKKKSSSEVEQKTINAELKDNKKRNFRDHKRPAETIADGVRSDNKKPKHSIQ